MPDPLPLSQYKQENQTESLSQNIMGSLIKLLSSLVGDRSSMGDFSHIHFSIEDYPSWLDKLLKQNLTDLSELNNKWKIDQGSLELQWEIFSLCRSSLDLLVFLFKAPRAIDKEPPTVDKGHYKSVLVMLREEVIRIETQLDNLNEVYTQYRNTQVPENLNNMIETKVNSVSLEDILRDIDIANFRDFEKPAGISNIKTYWVGHTQYFSNILTDQQIEQFCAFINANSKEYSIEVDAARKLIIVPK